MSDQVDPLSGLDEAIEKARDKGLMPGGSVKAYGRMQRRMLRATDPKRKDVGGGTFLWREPKRGKGREAGRADRAMSYTLMRGSKYGTRQGFRGKRTGLYKSAVEGLDAEIEKALRINGGVKVSPAQRRAIAVGRGRRGRGQFNIERTKRIGSAQYGGSKQKPFSNPGARGPSGSVALGPYSRSGVTRRVAERAKKEPSRQNKRTLKLVRANNAYEVDRFRRKRGEASPYKRTLFGGLKRIKKSDADIHKAKAKTLYVYRPVENAADIIAWAESQGFKSTQPAEKLHVTLAYSKTPLNWAMLHDDYHLEPSEYAQSCGCDAPMLRSASGGNKQRRISGGVREVKALGSDGAVVLAFESDSLTQRWMDFKRAGAAWSFPSFTPHITITYSGKGVDLSKVHPYAGDIVLGEECWEEVSENGQKEAIAAEKVTKAGLDDLSARLAAIEAKQAEPAKEAA